ESKAPIRVGATTATGVIALLGEPYERAPNDTAFAYKHEPVEAYVISIIGHMNGPVTRSRYLLLRFDMDGVLTCYKVINNWWDFSIESRKLFGAKDPASQPASN